MPNEDGALELRWKDRLLAAVWLTGSGWRPATYHPEDRRPGAGADGLIVVRYHPHQPTKRRAMVVAEGVAGGWLTP